MVRIRHSARIVFMSVALSLLAACATLGPSQQTAGEGAHARTASGIVHAANAALQHGDAGAALKQLAALPSNAPPNVQQEALAVQARAQLANGDRLAAARSLIRRAGLLPAPAQAADQQQAIAILAGMGRDALHQAYASLADNDPVKPWVQKAIAQPGAAAARVLPQPNQPVGTLQGAAAPQGYAMPGKVALLLPATGPVAVAGAAVRDGFFTAYFHAPATQEQRPAITVYDTGGTANGSVAAYKQAVADGAALVVGPLGRDAVGALFAQGHLPVPVLALNHPQGGTPTPAGSYEFALLPEAEGAQLAAHMITLGLHAAIVFRGNDDTASRTFDAFKTQFESLGGQVANDIVLQPAAWISPARSRRRWPDRGRKPASPRCCGRRKHACCCRSFGWRVRRCRCFRPRWCTRVTKTPPPMPTSMGCVFATNPGCTTPRPACPIAPRWPRNSQPPADLPRDCSRSAWMRTR